jgi:transketolase
LGAPTYIRLGKKGEPTVHLTEPEFKIGKGISMRYGSDVALISVGNMLSEVMLSAEVLESNIISAQVISLHTVKPLDELMLSELFKDKRLVVVVEEHALIGGASSAILEWGCDNGIDLNKLLRFGGPDLFFIASGNQKQARKFAGLTAENIAKKILDRLEQ